MMDIVTIDQQQLNRQPIYQQPQSVNYSRNVEESQVETLTVQPDRVTLSSEYSYFEEVTYNSNISINDLENSGYEVLRRYVASLLQEQGIESKVTIGDTEVDLTEISQEKAQQLVSEDGYFGVEQTSDRIVDFAMAIAGNDPARISAVREGIEKGFSEALEAFGGWLPDISYQTLDAVNEKLDSWIGSEA